MLKPTVKRGLMLDFIPDEIICPAEINENRVFKLNDKPINDGDIVYLASRELRLQDNWAVVFGLNLAKKHAKKFKIVVILDEIKFSGVQEPFLKEGLNFLKKNSALNNIDFEIVDKLPSKIGALIVDFNTVNLWVRNADYAIFEVDSHNIIPARHVSNKQEFSAATLRRKIYANIGEFLSEFPASFKSDSVGLESLTYLDVLNEFIDNKLNSYAEFKNNPNKDVTSNLSPFLHFGFISAQRIALEILKSSASRENKEAFLEELIVRKELSDNFCLYNKDYKSLNCLAPWAKATLDAHKSDIRTYSYNLKDFEEGKTHDELWNKAQQNLLKTGKIHGYLRMYWAKKILEWSKTPKEALITAIYLNDTYALDGNDPNGYVGILWSIGGIHDRPFSNRMVTGKIRYMSLNGCKAKFDVKKYLRG